MAETKSWDDLLKQMQSIVEEWNNEYLTRTLNNPQAWGSYSTPTYYVPFSTLDSLNMQAQAWDWTDTDISSAYKNLANWLGSYSNTANTIADFYNTAANQIANREWVYANASFQLANDLNRDIANQRDYIWSVFGPEGSLTTEMNRYYDDMWNYLASEWGRQMAKVAAQWLHSWASLWLLRAQQNKAYNDAFANYLKVKEQEINAKQKIQAQLINYMTQLRAEYGNTTNQYILAQYKRANDLLNTLTTDLAKQYTTIGLYRLQWGSWSWSWSWNGSNGSSSLSNLISNGNSWSNDNWNWWSNVNWWSSSNWWIGLNNLNEDNSNWNVTYVVSDANEPNSLSFWQRLLRGWLDIAWGLINQQPYIRVADAARGIYNYLNNRWQN